METGRKHALLAVLVLGSVAAAFFVKPISQPPGYHDFADQRTLWGMPHFMDVVSNLPFLVVGGYGLYNALSRTDLYYPVPEARWPWTLLALAILLTGFGSAYYHRAPSDATLFWDRLPMSIGFSALLGIMILERVNPRLGRWGWIPIVLAGVGSLLYWRWQGDLRFYYLLQVWAVLLVGVILALFRAPCTQTGALVEGIASYAGSKLLELLDAPIFSLTHVASGHTLKHLAAAAGSWFLFMHLLRRRPV
ncbi:MAG TPA: alkaline phytoceramidase [Planctomycetota bacterium]|nr:alkaline phytoceramidase [Planctomycetota bacterium]